MGGREGKVADWGVEGRVGGCEESAKRKREARWEVRFLVEGGVVGRAKCVDFGVEGVEGAGVW